MGTGVTSSLNEVYYFVSGILTSLYQVAQSSTQQGECEPVLMYEDRPVPEDQDESENEEYVNEKDEEWCIVDNENDEEEEVSMQWAILQSLYTLRDLLVFYHRQWERR